MSARPNSMSPAWCATRVAEARQWLRDTPQATPGWQHVNELFSQLDNPPAAGSLSGERLAALAKKAATSRNGCATVFAEDLADLVSATTALAAAEARATQLQQELARWVPVGERLPLAWVTVLAVCLTDDGRKLRLACHNGFIWHVFEQDDSLLPARVSHWCIVPAPPDATPTETLAPAEAGEAVASVLRWEDDEELNAEFRAEEARAAAQQRADAAGTDHQKGGVHA